MDDTQRSARDAELDDLRELVACPGWQRLIDYATKTYGPLSLATAVMNLAADIGDTAAGQRIMRLSEASRSVGLVFGWPAQRIAALDQQAATPELPEDVHRDRAGQTFRRLPRRRA